MLSTVRQFPLRTSRQSLRLHPSFTACSDAYSLSTKKQPTTTSVQRRSFTKATIPLSLQSSTAAKMPSTPETASYRFNHTMIRVKDPEKSLKFYQDVLGMDLIDEHDAGSFKLFFLAYDSPEKKNLSRGEREGILELTWNKGTEKDDKFQYHNGNDEPQGFGHTCIAVDDLEKACARFEKLGVEFKKKPSDGKMRHIAFIYDPDRYWIEIIAHGKPQ